MSPLLFFLGRSPQLALAEIRSFFPDAVEDVSGIVTVTDTLTLNGKDVDPVAFLAAIGGTVKVAEMVGTTDSLTPEQLIKFIPSTGRPVFGVSSYGFSYQTIRAMIGEMKALLDEMGIPARYIEPHDGNELSGVAVEHGHVTEINIIKKNDGYIIALTRAVQPFEEWSKRDYGRPHADAKAGMLPPKVSRMVANIGLGADAKGKMFVDPFCGMGTVLSEALLRGAAVIGTDTSEEAVVKARKNIEWLSSTYPGLSTSRVEMHDATHLSDLTGPGSIDAVATEPYMGSPRLGEGKVTDPTEISHIIKGLVKLYIGSLREWQKVLKPNGVVVMAFPEYKINGRTYFVKKAIDSFETLGYTKVLGPLPYGREKAVVQRMFYVLRKAG